jgi:3-dehydroquinate dehydratase II
MKILILNGPNLNLTGLREPAIYGGKSLEQLPALMDSLRESYPALEYTLYQSNNEGELVTMIQDAAVTGYQGIIINPGGFTHTSVAIADALRAAALPAVEVHLSHIYNREEFRRHNVVAGACRGSISGLGLTGYPLAARYLLTELIG